MLTPDLLERLGAAPGLDDCEPVAFEVDAADRANRLLVVDEEDERRRFRQACSAATRFRPMPDAAPPDALRLVLVPARPRRPESLGPIRPRSLHRCHDAPPALWLTRRSVPDGAVLR